ncbi:SPW repeat protein [Candidatus Wolfebacteria bacterium]|nr:SPW repeat protein [Candidatus Wolfebacteria bacterium]
MKYYDWIKLILGVWIFASPWILDFSGINLALWNNVIIGGLMIIFSLWRIFSKKIENNQ